MKAISLWPPYGSLIVAGVKKIETRSWGTSFRGRVAIHHTQTIPSEIYEMLNDGYFHEALALADYPDLNHGCVVGTVEITDSIFIHTNSRVPDDLEATLGNYTIDRFMWMLADPVKFDKPIPAKGKQGFWEWAGPDGARLGE